jgi:hypothetical protein
MSGSCQSTATRQSGIGQSWLSGMRIVLLPNGGRTRRRQWDTQYDPGPKSGARERRLRDRAMFELEIDSKLRGL